MGRSTHVADNLCFSWKHSLLPFSLSSWGFSRATDETLPSCRTLSDGKLLTSLWTLSTMVIAVFFYLLSQKHKTALHVQHPTRNLHTYTCVRTFSTCCLNKRQHTTRTTPYNTRNLHTYTCVCTFLPVGSTQDSTLHAHHPTRNLHTYTCRTFIYTYPGTAVVLFKSIVAIFTPILRFFLSFSFVFRGCLAQFE